MPEAFSRERSASRSCAAFLVERGVQRSELFHFGPEGQTPGVDPERRDFGSYISFADPDGNG